MTVPEYSTYFRPKGLTASRRCTPGSSATPTGPTRIRPGRWRWSSAARPGSSSTPPSNVPARASCSCSSPRRSTPGWRRSPRAGRTRSSTSSRGWCTTGTSATAPRPGRAVGRVPRPRAARRARARPRRARRRAAGRSRGRRGRARRRRRAAPHLRPGPPARGRERAEHAAVRRARAHLRERWDQRVTLAELAAVAGLSRFELVRRFREQNGVTPHAFQTNLRVEHARGAARRRRAAGRGRGRVRVRRPAPSDPRVQARGRRQPGRYARAARPDARAQ